MEELLPPIEDLPTWPSVWEFSALVNSTLREPGFVEGRKATYFTTIKQVSEKVLYFFVYRFIDGNSAKTYHDTQVDAMKSQGLYTIEVAIPGAFAVLFEYDYEEEGISLGYVSNIVFKIYLYNDFRKGFWYFPLDSLRTAEDELRFFTNLHTSIIPEFPTFIIFPLFMIATSLAVIVYKRKHL
ncbi:MAG: hypothetical protein NWE97_01325 [Candidatus Bathyarchaeota archaeon]|nr:hypothetical protein [Candidatus Bathyarchaeota archaeon]MCZ2807736.1 hypothetical protein [Candidatus Bathyarchaeota archaeon]